MQKALSQYSASKEEGTQKLGSILGGILVAYCLIKIGTYFYPSIRNIDATFLLYVVIFCVIGVIGFKTGTVSILSRAVKYCAFFIIYYLFTIRNSPDILVQFKEIRNIALVGFVLLFAVLGIVTMVTARRSKELHKSVQLVFPSLVTSLILVIFSYAIVTLLRDIATLIGI